MGDPSTLRQERPVSLAGTLDLHMQMEAYMSLCTDRKTDDGSGWSLVEPNVSRVEQSAASDEQPSRSQARSSFKARPGGLWTAMAEQQKSEWIKYLRLVK